MNCGFEETCRVVRTTNFGGSARPSPSQARAVTAVVLSTDRASARTQRRRSPRARAAASGAAAKPGGRRAAAGTCLPSGGRAGTGTSPLGADWPGKAAPARGASGPLLPSDGITIVLPQLGSVIVAG